MCLISNRCCTDLLNFFKVIGQLDFAAAADIIRCTLAPSAGDVEQ